MPPPEVLWAVGLTTCGAVIAWAFGQIMLARDATRQLSDHILECDKRQIFIMEILTRIGAKLMIEPPTQPR